jgi:hypothetical protein
LSTTTKALSFILLVGAAAAPVAAQQPQPPAPTEVAPPAEAPPADAPAAAKPAAKPAAPSAKTSAQSEAGEPRADTSAGSAPAPARTATDARAGAKPGTKIDRLDLGTATVTGDREQPKVMYIVPWKRSDIGDLTARPMNSLVDEILAPVDRDVFKREVVYYHAVQSDTSQNGAALKPAPQGEK